MLRRSRAAARTAHAGTPARTPGARRPAARPPVVRRPARLPAVLLAVLLAAALSACDQTLPGAGTANPEAGQCHTIQSPEEFDATSEPSPPVPCDVQHTTQTFFVTAFPLPLAAQQARPNQQQLKVATARLCTTQELRTYLSGTDRDGTIGVAITGYYPSREDWARGSRAVRCDVLLTEADGTPKWTTGDLKGALGGPDAAGMRLCYRQELNDGVPAAEGQDVPCSEPHTAEDVGAWIAQDASLDSPAAQQERCLAYALEFLETGTMPADVVVRPVIRAGEGTRTVRCAVAPLQGTVVPVTGSLAPRNPAPESAGAADSAPVNSGPANPGPADSMPANSVPAAEVPTNG